ncbi:MAG: hypothetical protein V4603_17485 [Pseudomonadota bacterium]
MAQVKLLKLAFITLSLAAASAHAHTARATLDPAGTNAHFTALARVTCFNDGSGPAVGLYVRIRDNSPAVTGLLVNAQILKGTQALATTDTVSGDASWSDPIQIDGAGGVYTVIVNKTAAGARNFDIEWHCVTTGHDHDHIGDIPHTGTEILVDQFK